MKQLRIGIDVDDVLMECTSYAIDLANEEYRLSPPLDVNKINGWGYTGMPTDIIFDYFKEKSFYQTQPVRVGAHEFIRCLISQGHDVFLITAVALEMAEIRIRRLQEEFPEVPKENIVITSRKDICQLDVLLDDAPHNYFDSTARYPVLFRRPWNKFITGVLSVNNYTEFLSLISGITSRSLTTPSQPSLPNHDKSIVCLIGPSCSGKTAIAKFMRDNYGFSIPVSCTTRPRRANEPENAYQFIRKEEFEELQAKNRFLETSVYAGHEYGLLKETVSSLLDQRKKIILPMDICGGNAMKAFYGDRAITAFVKRDKASILRGILDRDVSNEDKYNRIISLDAEQKNAQICDIVIQNKSTLESACKQILDAVS